MQMIYVWSHEILDRESKSRENENEWSKYQVQVIIHQIPQRMTTFSGELEPNKK